MRKPQIYTAWTIACQSPADAQAFQVWLSAHINLDRILVDTLRTGANGAEQVVSAPHRLGDYFLNIGMLPGKTPTSFQLVFQRLPAAERYWKDLMVTILQEIQAAPVRASVTLDYKGDETLRTITNGVDGERTEIAGDAR